MSFSTEFRTYCLTQSGLTDLIGSKLSAYPIPRDYSGDYGSYQIISGVRDPILDAPSGILKRRVQVESWSDTYDQAWLIADQFRAALSGYNGIWGSIEISEIELANEFPDYQEAIEKHRIIQDYAIIHNE